MEIEYLRSARELERAARELGLNPIWIEPHGLIRVTVRGETKYLYNSVTHLSPQLAGALAANKYSTRKILDSLGEPNPAYSLLVNRNSLVHFINSHHDVVVKPFRQRERKFAHRFKAGERVGKLPVPYRDLLAEEYMPGRELRCVVLNHEVLVMQWRDVKNGHPLLNKTYCTAIESSDWPRDIAERAPRILAALGLKYGAVDFIVDDRWSRVLEVNSAPGIWHLCKPDAGVGTDVATAIIRAEFNL